MSNQLAIEVLQKRRVELLKDRQQAWIETGKKILEVEDALRELGECIPKDPEHVFVYDDESPDYIKQSIES